MSYKRTLEAMKTVLQSKLPPATIVTILLEILEHGPTLISRIKTLPKV